MYNATLQDLIGTRLGWTFAPRSDQQENDPNGIHELTGVPEALITAFSARRAQVEAEYTRLVAAWRDKHGAIEIPRAVQYQLAQAATLTDRPAKDATRTAGDERADWRQIAADTLTPGQYGQLRDQLRPGRENTDVVRAGDLDAERISELATATIGQVQHGRATFTIRHLQAAAHRFTRELTFATPADRAAVIEQITTHITQTRDAGPLGQVLLLEDPPAVPEPEELHRGNGESVWRAHAAERYTTSGGLDAETRLVAAAHDTSGPGITAGRVDDAMWRPASTGVVLAADHEAAVRAIATSSRRLEVLIGPAGTGKTTTMATLSDAWRTADAGRVIALSVADTAAQLLARETSADGAANLTRWLTGTAHRAEWAQLQPGDLVIVDEAGMAPTAHPDRLAQHAAAAGAKVLLVGGPRQLTAVETGGALRLLERDGAAHELSTVWRFRDENGEARRWEIDASLALRVGNTAAVDAYLDHGRLHGGDRDTLVADLYAAWKPTRIRASPR